MVVAMAVTLNGRMYACRSTIGGGGGVRDEKAVVLLCDFPSYISSAAISCLLSFWFQNVYWKAKFILYSGFLNNWHKSGNTVAPNCQCNKDFFDFSH